MPREIEMNETSSYGLWSLVIINSLFFIAFAFSFTRPPHKPGLATLGRLLGLHPRALHRDVRLSVDDLPALGVAVFEISESIFLPTISAPLGGDVRMGAVTRTSARFTS